MAKLVRNLENATKKYMNKKEAFKALQTELQNGTVPLEEFNRIKEACERQNTSWREAQEKTIALNDKVMMLNKEINEVDAEK